MRKVLLLIAVLAAFGLFAASCGDDDGGETDSAADGGETTTTAAADGGETTTTAAAADGGETTTTAAAEDGETEGDGQAAGLDVESVCAAADAAPVEIVVMAEIAGESPAAVDDFWNGALLAQSMINETCGSDIVSLERISTGFLVDEAEPKLLEAQEAEPTAILGLVSSSQAALAPVVDAGGIPQIYMVGTASMLEGGDNFTEWGWPIRVVNDAQGLAWGSYFVDQGVLNIANACVETQFGISACDGTEQVVTDGGGEIVLERSFATDASDFSGFIVDMQDAGAEGVAMAMFPGAQLTLTQQIEDNELLESVLPIGGSSTELIYKGMSEAAQAKVVASADCNPREDAPEVNDLYSAEYGTDMTGLATTTFDGVFLVVDAVARLGATGPDEVAEGISTTGWGGVCQDYFDSGNHALAHRMVITGFEGGTINTLQEIQLADNGIDLAG